VVPVYGIFFTIWYVNVFDSVVSSEKDITGKVINWMHCSTELTEAKWMVLTLCLMRYSERG